MRRTHQSKPSGDTHHMAVELTVLVAAIALIVYAVVAQRSDVTWVLTTSLVLVASWVVFVLRDRFQRPRHR